LRASAEKLALDPANSVQTEFGGPAVVLAHDP